MSNLPAQSVAWNPNLFVGYSEKEIALIKVGADWALNEAYQAEKDAESMRRYERRYSRPPMRKLLMALKTIYTSTWPASCPPEWRDMMRAAINEAEGKP